MRLPTDVRTRFLALGLTALLAACGRGGSEPSTLISTGLVSAGDMSVANADTGPAADYPMVLGDPYTVDGQLYTPIDSMNVDEVGFAAMDPAGGTGISAAHKTLPLPSYVEITALDSGKTILARVERRGPMTGSRVAGLSLGAMTQLGIGEEAPIRIRRVNPPETDRAKLRTGQTAAERMATPRSLLAVLKRKLSKGGFADLQVAKAKPSVSQLVSKTNSAPPRELPAIAAPQVTRVAAASTSAPPPPRSASFEQAFRAERKAVTAYPLAPLNETPRRAARMPAAPIAAPATPRPARVAVAPAQRPASQSRPLPQAADGFVVQAAAFSSKTNAERAANSIDGFVQQSGRFYRVRKGPFANRGQAEAALAKVRAAGYSDARVYTSG